MCWDRDQWSQVQVSYLFDFFEEGRVSAKPIDEESLLRRIYIGRASWMYIGCTDFIVHSLYDFQNEDLK